jgi:hypothetical protein
MIEFGDKIYYIDMKALEKAISAKGSLKPGYEIEVNTVTTKDEKDNVISVITTENKREKGKEIDGTKYDILRLCLETIIDYNDDIDESMGAERGLSKTPFAYKLAFNTLMEEGVLKEQE